MMHVDCFTTTDKATDYATVKREVLAAGRFSTFEASATDLSARIFTRLCKDPDLETFDMGYPWTGVREKVNKRPKGQP